MCPQLAIGSGLIRGYRKIHIMQGFIPITDWYPVLIRQHLNTETTIAIIASAQ